MLELLFRGFFEWIYGLILECWEYFSSVLFDLMSLDFAYLETNMPIITTIRQIMLGVGWALLLGNLVFQATRSMMAGVGFEADDPKLLFTRTFVFSFLLVASPQICDICLNMTSVIMTFEELRIRKSEDFLDLEEGKNVSWSVEYGTIRKDVKDPKGTTIISMKESIERSREFLDALKKAKDKNPDCIVRPKVTMKNKGTAAYKGTFPTVEAARNSDKVICLIPGNDGHIYEMHKTEQGEFIAPKHKIIDFQAVAAGFTPALPLIPLSLMRQIIAFFRSFMAEHGQEYEALALIYWDKWKEEYLAYVPKQNVSKAGIHASLQENPYDDESRYIHYADIHSHNSMEAFFSSIDDADERGTGIYMVLGHLDHFYPEIAARICCGGSFVDIDPGTVVEGLEEPFPPEWCTEVSHGKAPVSRVSPRKAEKTGIWGWKALDLLLGDLK